MDQPFRERFWDIICSSEYAFHYLFVFAVTFLIVGLVPWPFLKPGSAARVVLTIDIAIFGTVIVGVVYVLYQCRKRREAV